MDKNKKLALTDAQLGMYLECIDEANPSYYLIPLTFEFPLGQVDPEKLRDAFYEVEKAFTSFSTVIEVINAEPLMKIYDGELPKLSIVNTNEDEVKAHKRDLYKEFSFDGSLLWRGEILCTSKNIYILLVIHHTIFDGSSIAVLNDALAKAYNGEPLTETGTVFDAKTVEEAMVNGDAFADAKRYFDAYLDGLDGDSNITPDKAIGNEIIYKTTQYTVNIAEDELKPFAKANGVSENIVFLSAFIYALSKMNNQNDVVFSSVESGRFGGGYDNSIGMFVKSFPLRFLVDEEKTSTDFIKGVKANYIDTLKHNFYKYSALAEEYQGITDVHYIYQGEMQKGIPVNGTVPKINVLDTYEPVSNFDFMVYKEDGSYHIWIGYKENLYTKDIVDCFADFYQTVVKEMTSGNNLSKFDLVSTDTRAQMDKLNSTEDKYDMTRTVSDIFEETASKYGDNIAVSYKDKSYTYRQVDCLVNKVATYLKSKGIGREDYVPVLIPRNEYMAICTFGILKAGAAYQPLDPTYPEERLNFMVSDSGAKVMIADRELIGLVSEYKGDVLFTDEIESLTVDQNLPIISKPEDAALLIYTSGTTGTPKGCMLENGNIVALVRQHTKNVELSENSKSATIASYGFDAAAMDIFGTILNGGELCVIPDEIKLDIPQVEKFYLEKGITNGFMTTQLGRMFLEQTKCKTLRHFVVGGEKLVPFNPPTWVKCHNGYGPSESIAYICYYDIKDDSIYQPIGKPHGNVKLYIVDSHDRLLPPGCAGELCIASPQVARGYLGRPEKTEEAFKVNPFCDDVIYKRLYKTGDIVRMLPDGNYDFIGRRDGQVKIRGFRIELTEIEQVVRSYEGITNATVQAFDDAVSGKFVAAFIVSKDKVDIDDLNAFIASQKPAYMVPAVTMQLDSIPVNANGKVDKKKLPKPERKFEEIVLPETETQKRIFDLVASVLGITQFGIDTDFYMAGLSSIGSIKLCSLLADEFNVSIQMKDIRQNNTIRKLETLLGGAKEKKETPKIFLKDYPITKTQEGIFVECVSKTDSTVYNIPLLLKLSKNIDLEKLKVAIVKTVDAHPYLKTELFTDEDGDVRQKRKDQEKYSVEDIEIVKGKALDEIKASAVTPFTLLKSRLFRFRIYQGEENYLFIEIHHIISDGTSINVLLTEIEKAYGGEELKAEAYDSFDLSLDEQQRRSTSALKEAENYYASLLGGLDMNFLIGKDRMPSAPKDSGTLLMSQCLASVDEVKVYCEKNKIGINGLLCSVFGFVVAKYAGLDYSVFNTIYNGRNDSRVASTIGMLVKTMPVVCNIDKDKPLDVAMDIKEQLIDSMSNDLYSFAEIAKDHGVKNDIIFIYQGDNFEFSSFCGEKSEKVELSLSESKAPLTLEVSIEDNEFKYLSEYNPELFTEGLIKTFITAFDKAISSFVKEEDIKNISLVTDDMLKKLDEYNETEFSYDDTKTIPVLFAEQTKLHREKDVIVYKEKTYTYEKAFDTACRIGAHLKSKGVGRGSIVAILINRDENMIPCSHGVIMSGACYVGLDPTYPMDRLEFMLEDSECKFVIADRKLTGLISNFNGEIIYTDELENLPKAPENFSETFKEISPDDNAFIVYSSGTTGKPKGAILAHKNIVCFLQNYQNDMALSDKTRMAMYASFGFDGGAMDVLCMPMVGATLFVIPDDIRLDLSKLEQFYIKNKITNGFMTTQVGTMFISNTKCKTLTHFQVGGEKFIPSLPPEGVVFYNGYGPSETMCYVNNFMPLDLGDLQPIGKATLNVKEYLIDKYGNRLPFGACGELCIASGQTGKGYLNRPEKTAESFVKNPFCDIPPYDRMYKTGDIVRQMTDGNYVFEGRRDGQVKIRGFRVELTEVEQVIRQYEGIKTCTVGAFDSPAGGKFIAAYIVSDEEIDIASLNAFIASTKPDYMVPAVTLQIDEIPLTANGKVDKRNLPKPVMTNIKKGAEPANEIEEIICDIFGEVLGLDKVYADDDFFSIGGSSISAIKVAVKCENAGYNIVFKNLFANPTPHELSEFIQGSHNEEILAPGEGEKEKYDYSSLEFNKVEYVDEITFSEIGDVLLTGSTGFLGSHIFKELIDNTPSKVICLVRGKGDIDPPTRFHMMMTYYFEDWYTEEVQKRVTVLDVPLENMEELRKLEEYHFDTIINSAANVKHFAAGDQLLQDNFTSVENLITLAEETKALLVQISSTSVSGEAVDGKVSDEYMFKECDLNIGQSLENKYIYSKYQAEQALIDAVSRGRVRGKIIRLGNLMARIDDSEFQINAASSGFLKQFIGFKKLSMFPINMMDKGIEFSPIDSTAKAVVLLSGTPDKFTVFHAKNCNKIHYSYFIYALKREGIDIKVVGDDVFANAYQKALESEEDVLELSSLIAYKNNSKDGEEKATAHQIDSETEFTTKALYRLGFAWPLVSNEYLERMVKTLKELGFFG